MPTEYIIWIVVAGVVGLVIGFVAGYFALRNTANRHRGELMDLRSRYEEHTGRLEEYEQRFNSLNRRVEEKDNQLKAAHDEIHHLEQTLEEKTGRERKAIETLREAFHEDVTTNQQRAADARAEQERRRVEAEKAAEDEYRARQVEEARRK